MRVALDRSECAGIGVGRVEIRSPALDGDAIDVVREALDMCPTAALRIVE